MFHSKKRLFVKGMVCAIATLASSFGYADEYPSKPIRLVIPFAAGGPTDGLGRSLAERLSDALNQRVVVENKGGAGGNIGTDLVAKSPADGYTIVLTTNGPLAGNLTLFGKLPYDPIKDFEPITLFAYVPNMLAINPTVIPANNVAEFIAHVRANPDKYSFGSGGNGTSSHLAGELLKTMAGLKMTHIPYKGDGASIVDTLSGQVPIVFCSVLAGMRYMDTGKFKPLAVTSINRVPAISQIPPMAEAGLPNYDLAAWYSVMAPAGTPKPIVKKLNEVIVKITNTPEFRKKIESMGAIPVGSTPEEVTRLIKADIPKWGKIIKDSGAKVD